MQNMGTFLKVFGRTFYFFSHFVANFFSFCSCQLKKKKWAQPTGLCSKSKPTYLYMRVCETHLPPPPALLLVSSIYHK